jgi:outer membrane receptor protein involved in Fe transport
MKTFRYTCYATLAACLAAQTAAAQEQEAPPPEPPASEAESGDEPQPEGEAPTEGSEAAPSEEAPAKEAPSAEKKPAAAPEAAPAEPLPTAEPAAGGASAAFAESEAFSELSLTNVLDIKLTTGSFLELDMAHSPMSMTVIDQEKIRVSGARHLGELLEIYVPGFQLMVNKWNGDIWGMRGVAADRNTKVIFLINGLRLNTESRDGNFTETTLGLMGDIERVEVLRGPAGLAYGSGAIAGVVNIVTRKAKKSSGEATVGYGSWNSFGAEATSFNELGDDEWLILSAGHRRSDGAGEGQSRVYGNHSWPTPGVGNPDGRPTDGSAWATPGNTRVSADYHKGNFRLYSRFTRRQQTAGEFFVYDPFPQYGPEVPPEATARYDGRTITGEDPMAGVESFGTNRRLYVVDAFHVNGTYEIPLETDRVWLDAAVMGVTNRTEYEIRDKYQLPGEGQPGGAVDNSMGERRYFLGARYRMNRVDRLTSVVGTQMRWDDLGDDLQGHNMHGTVARRKSISDVTYHNIALFTENQYDLGMVELHGGVRADYHTRTGVVLSPKLATVLAFNEDHALKFIFQTSANYGSADNYEHNWRHFENDGSVSTQPRLERPEDVNSDRIPNTSLDVLHRLRPEKVVSYEIASFHRLDNLTLMTSASLSQISNLFAWNQQLFRIVNAGSYNVLSLEGDVQYDADPVIAGVSHVHQRPIFTDTGESARFTVPATEIVDNGDGTYDLRLTDEPPDVVSVNAVRDSITTDGKNFLNLATDSSKLYATYSVLPWLKLHTNTRVHWGLPGRRGYYDEDRAARGDNYLGVDRNAMIRWNASAHFALPSETTISLYVNNILGEARSNRHAVRWQQMAEPSQREIYTTELRYYYASVTKKF